MMHHNKYELGPDVFNQGYWITKQVEEKLKALEECTIEEAKALLGQKLLNETQKFHMLLSKNNDFIYKATLDLIKFVEEKMAYATMYDVRTFLTSLFVPVKWPRIGERIDY